MSHKEKIDLDDAYAVETPADNIRLYAQWANSYDADFVSSNGYVSYLRVAELLASNATDRSGTVLDVGCGTGVGGIALREHGFDMVDGVDISEEMLAEAHKKLTRENKKVYRNLIQADLTQKIEIDDNRYAGLVSSGTFTHGHLGPEALCELWRVAAPGAVCAIGINAHHFESRGFRKKIEEDVDNQAISAPKFIEVDMYASPGASVSAENRTAVILVCQIL